MPRCLLFLAAMFLIAACEEGSRMRPRPWIPYSGLEWSERHEDMMNWDAAKEYCASIGGRLPTIDELRTLVVECPNTMPDGICPVSDPTCLKLSCMNGTCHCPSPSKSVSILGDDYGIRLWSSATLANDDTMAWGLWFYDNQTWINYKKYEGHVRCVKLTPEEINDTEKPDDITEYGLFWSERAGRMHWQEAADYCETLEDDGHDDWRLPTINELRTIIVNCPATMPGGSCRVSDPDCLDIDCREGCFCDYGDEDKMSFSALGDSNSFAFWSSSFITKKGIYNEDVWMVGFRQDNVIATYAKFEEFYVRCVRTPATDIEQPDETVDTEPPDIDYGIVPPGEMVDVPAGEFWMGCNETEDDQCDSNEYPYHAVTLSAYKIGRNEVTVAEYQQCINAGVCNNNGEYFHYHTVTDDSKYCYYGLEGKENHPMQCVSWYGAKAYCEWIGGRLPTEAEWEKAARGTDGRKYPWGNTPTVSCDYAVVNDVNTGGAGCGSQNSLPVGSKPKGVSPYGAHDMIGNEWEWANDWYDEDYYASSPTNDPAGPETGNNRALRGGSWYSGIDTNYLRASSRISRSPDKSSGNVGFRCVRTPSRSEQIRELAE